MIEDTTRPDTETGQHTEAHRRGEHPAWCSPEHCQLQHPAWCCDDQCEKEHGQRCHEQAPVVWVDEATQVRVESQLAGDGDLETWVELELRNLLLTQTRVYLPISTTRRLRDQLSDHLDTFEAARRGRGWVYIGSCGHQIPARASGAIHTGDCQECDAAEDAALARRSTERSGPSAE